MVESPRYSTSISQQYVVNLMEIPHTALSPDTLHALIEEFVLREGTDYGEFEVPLAQKTQQIMNQLDHGDIVIVFDTETESCNIVRKHKE